MKKKRSSVYPKQPNPGRPNQERLNTQEENKEDYDIWDGPDQKNEGSFLPNISNIARVTQSKFKDTKKEEAKISTIRHFKITRREASEQPSEYVSAAEKL